MKEELMEMVRVIDIIYSYKSVILKAMLESADEKGKVLIEDIGDCFIEFCKDRKFD
jgi:hypothetical protein